MQKLLAALALAFLLLSPQAHAQVAPKAYAPENIGQLSTRDQARVIREEYADQSNGRQIPDDQLDFYLAQIRSGWRFSQIKNDIATSLRGNGNGNGGGWNGGNNGGNWGGNGQVVRCESANQRYRECPTNFRNRAVLRRELSKADCLEGRSWGQRQGMVWVNWGCRAEFTESNAGWEGDRGYTVTCSSPSEGYTTCAWNSRYGRPQLIEKLSRSECIEGRTWGYRGNSIWVDRGCRARFAPGR
ncbi:DUF3011 domain-containing protein [Arenimonas sp. MALMAid1274]|uniref:DUF3011 domain-containing protein n=1 Tax=Arenimonas sp. MALMAid1274 TaxID=3411630 RepID=UPI003B9E34AC